MSSTQSIPEFGDNVRVNETDETRALRVAGLIGKVHGFTQPSITGVEVIGGPGMDYGLYVFFRELDRGLWFAPELLSFVDHGAGTEAQIGGRRFVRTANGDWVSEH